jgi:hypothetical protein
MFGETSRKTPQLAPRIQMWSERMSELGPACVPAAIGVSSLRELILLAGSASSSSAWVSAERRYRSDAVPVRRCSSWEPNLPARPGLVAKRGPSSANR